MKRRLMKLRTRFVLFILLGVGLVGLGVTLVTFFESGEMATDATQRELMSVVQTQAERLSHTLDVVAQKPMNLATTLLSIPYEDEDQVKALLKKYMEARPMVLGMAVAFNPEIRKMSPYYFRTTRGLRYKDLAEGGYDYPHQEWYQVPALTKKTVWSEPYFDEGGAEQVMTTISVPMVLKGKLIGIVTADVGLAELGRETARLAVGQHGWAFVLTKTGTFLSAPDSNWIMRESIFSLAESAERPDLRRLGRRMTRGGSGVAPVTEWRDGNKAWIAFAPVKGAGWSFGAVVTEKEIMLPVHRLAKKLLIAAGVGLVLMVAVVLFLVFNLTRPLKTLAGASRRLASGDLSTKIEDIPSGDEIGDVAESFNAMVDDLNRYVVELTDATAAKERIESELDLARQIQQSILPRIYPPFPDRPEFDLYGAMEPAREVGGDFYDFFMLDEDHLGLVMGDVSGKGVPSALFMTVSRTLIKNAALHHRQPDLALREANAQIVPDNEMCMFVTVFYGVYQISTGRLLYANAGHEPPLVRRTDGKVERLSLTGGMAMGVVDPLPGDMLEAHLDVGDAILIYTDGLDEAINDEDEMFGLERIMGWFSSAKAEAAPDMLIELTSCQKEFTGEREQFDDLTLLLMRRQS